MYTKGIGGRFGLVQSMYTKGIGGRFRLVQGTYTKGIGGRFGLAQGIYSKGIGVYLGWFKAFILEVGNRFGLVLVLGLGLYFRICRLYQIAFHLLCFSP